MAAEEKIFPLDFKGTVEVRENGNSSMISYLKGKGVDIERYYPIGASFTSYNSSVPCSFEASINCIDKEKSQDDIEHIVSFKFELKEITPNEFFSMFSIFCVTFRETYKDVIVIKEVIKI